MSARSAPSVPPSLAGFTHVRHLGSGGFADVFLYQQHLPQREVAVKVLLADVITDDSRRQFDAEANLMARVSAHPSIVTIYHADIADDGRPYLVMEHCTGASLSSRYRRERIGVSEALRVGIRLAGAVETAHRAGILHRDIKPANVLTTAFGWPALTDFGISAATTGSTQALGMSIPWSAPEMFDEPPAGGVEADVYALAATVYSLLAGRSPFEVPGGSNSSADLVTRISKGALAPTGREDVPGSLERVLASGMALRPEARPQSALELARALQQVETELSLTETAIDVPEEPAPAPSPDGGDDATRIRGVVAVDPLPAPRSRRTDPRQVAVAATPAEQAVLPPAGPGAVPDRSRLRAGVVVAGVLAVVVGIAAIVALGGREGQPGPGQTTPPGEQDALIESVPAPASLAGEAAEPSTLRFTWTNPDPAEGDSFLWRRLDPEDGGSRQHTEDAEVEIGDLAAGDRVCIEVVLRRANGRTSATPATACATAT